MAEEPIDDAGAYVLGLLEPDERRAFVRRLAREPGLVEEVAAWQGRLAPLALALPPVAPPPVLWARIERSIDAPANDNRAGLWKPLAVAASLVAAMLGAALTQRGVAPSIAPPAPIAVTEPARGGTMLAALSSEGKTPGLFIRYDKASDRITIMPVGLTADEAHDLQLWLIRGKEKPKPMWLLDPARESEHSATGQITGDVVLAVSREPRGGSPTGLPTGPVLYSGALVRMPSSSS